MRQPWTRGFSLILRISSGRRALTQSSGRTQRWTSMPTLAQRFRMLLSYATPSGRAPTRTMARVGAVPLSRRTRTLGDRASHSASAAGAPRRISAMLPPPFSRFLTERAMLSARAEHPAVSVSALASISVTLPRSRSSRVFTYTFMAALSMAARHSRAAQPTSLISNVLPFSSISSSTAHTSAQRSSISMGAAQAPVAADSSASRRAGREWHRPWPAGQRPPHPRLPAPESAGGGPPSYPAGSGRPPPHWRTLVLPTVKLPAIAHRAAPNTPASAATPPPGTEVLAACSSVKSAQLL